MTKNDIILDVTRKFGLSPAVTEEIVSYTLNLMHAGAMRDGSATFGPCKFVRKEFAPRLGHDVHLRQVREFPPRVVVAMVWDNKKSSR